MSPIAPLRDQCHYPASMAVGWKSGVFGALAVGLALALGSWSGLARLGWVIPPLAPHHPTAHGPLMVGGFLGIAFGLEMAVRARRGWGFAVPILALGSTLAAAMSPGAWAGRLATLASLVGVGLLVQELRLRDDFARRVRILGLLGWLLGNVLWMLTGAVVVAIPGWGVFAALSFLGLRLEASPAASPSSRAHLTFGVSASMAAPWLALVALDLGLRVLGAGLMVLAAWGLRWRWDSPRADGGLEVGWERFIAISLRGGDVWLAISGSILVIWGHRVEGLTWDAALHALFLGYVFSMLFAWTPKLSRAVSGHPPEFSLDAYGYLVLLHLSLALRVAGDFAGSPDVRAVGASLNMVAIAMFLLGTLRAAVAGIEPRER